MTPSAARLRLEALRQQPASPEAVQELANLAATLAAALPAQLNDGPAAPQAAAQATVAKARLISEALVAGPLTDADQVVPPLIREQLAAFAARIISPALEQDLSAWIAAVTAEARDAEAAITKLEAAIKRARLKTKILEQYRDLLDLTIPQAIQVGGSP